MSGAQVDGIVVSAHLPGSVELFETAQCFGQVRGQVCSTVGEDVERSRVIRDDIVGFPAG